MTEQEKQRQSGTTLEKDRRVPGAAGFVVEAGGHEGEWLRDAEAVGEAPAKQIGIATGDENAGAAVGLG